MRSTSVPFVSFCLSLSLSLSLSLPLAGCNDPQTSDAVAAPSTLDAIRTDVVYDETATPPAKKAGPVEPTSSTYPAPHPSMPRIPKNGGVVLHDPRIVTVTFGDDAWRDRIEAFDQQIGSLAWWRTVHDGYGVGPAVSDGSVNIKDMPGQRISDSDIIQWLSDKITDGTLPAPTDQSIYMLYYPQETTVTFNDVGGEAASCQVFLGYHANIDLPWQGGTVPVAYAVVNRCNDDFDQMTVTASHELTEASTDPHPTDSSNAGYVTLDDNAWTLLGGENGDMCAGVSSTTEAGWTLTRVWNNKTAALGDQPCLPAPDSDMPYFNAGIVHAELDARAGGSAKTEVDCYSFGPLPAAIDLEVQRHSESPLSFKLDKKSCTNGDKVTLTVSVSGKAQRGAYYHYSLLSSVDSKATHLWRGMVHVD